MIFTAEKIIFEDNHLLIINKAAGDLVQVDANGETGLEDAVKEFIKRRDNKPGAVFLGVVHRIDRPVSGAVIFAKTSKALTRMNLMVKDRDIKKKYLAIVERKPTTECETLTHFVARNSKKNRSYAFDTPSQGAKESVLIYNLIGASQHYYLLDIELITGRHHQVRSQLSKIGCPIKGDLKYGAPRSNKDGSISLHARSLEFVHPVTKEKMNVVAPVPKDDNLWAWFSESLESER